MDSDAEVIKQGTWIYAGEVVCDIRIVKHDWCYGSGDYEDDPEVRDDRQGEFYYVQYGSTTRRGEFTGLGQCCSSMEEALNEAGAKTNGTVKWND